MGATGMLHLRFDPPATSDQLRRMVRRLQDIDPDFPGLAHFTPEGTTSGHYGGSLGGLAWAYWRKPTIGIQSGGVLDSLGLRGHGWMIETYHEVREVPRAADHFAFGGHPYAAIIEADAALREREHEEFKAREAVLSAAREGDDARVVAAAAEWRAAIERASQ